MKKLLIFLGITGLAIIAYTGTSITRLVPEPNGNANSYLNGLYQWGTPTGSGGTNAAMVGTVSNAVVTSGLLAVDATKTNAIAATFAHVTNALGYNPMTNSYAAVTNALAAPGTLTTVLLGNGNWGILAFDNLTNSAAAPGDTGVFWNGKGLWSVPTQTLAQITNALAAPDDANVWLDGTGNWSAPAGAGNMVNTGPSVANMVPVYVDASGTALTPTNTLTLATVVADVLALPLAEGDVEMKIVGGTTNLVNVDATAQAALSKLKTNTWTGTGTAVLSSVTDALTNASWGTIGVSIDGAGSEIPDNVLSYIEVPYSCKIYGWTLIGSPAGAAVVNVWKCTYADFAPGTHPVVGDKITASAPPTITATAAKGQSADVSTWGTGTNVAAGDILAFNVDSCTTMTNLTLTMKVLK